MPFRYCSDSHVKVPQPLSASTEVWAIPRSLAATCGITICFLFLRVLRCFTSPGLAQRPYEFRPLFPGITREGLPHSEISGSKCVCHSPKLIAAYHVLRRLLVPRHPSCALLRLSSKFLASRLKLLALSLCNFQRTECPQRDSKSSVRRRIDFVIRMSAPLAAGLVGVPGVEPGTLSLSGTRSNQLSYTPEYDASTRQPRQSPVNLPHGWWRQPGLNR
jgi:hypothetical protein